MRAHVDVERKDSLAQTYPNSDSHCDSFYTDTILINIE